MIKDISIIGAGNLSQSLLYRVKESKAKIKIRLYDKDAKKNILAKKSNILFSTDIDDNISKSNIIIIAVKP
ncbi:MAG: NAD(P)-binding domain-containing protein, partial [Gammaproteobacteria bacterium]|nr:NAD(P)-binding domain-containing protein [Gammaproteobacteria bacterium]